MRTHQHQRPHYGGRLEDVESWKPLVSGVCKFPQVDITHLTYKYICKEKNGQNDIEVITKFILKQYQMGILQPLVSIFAFSIVGKYKIHKFNKPG